MLNHLDQIASLKWLSVHLWTKWLWTWVQLQSLTSTCVFYKMMTLLYVRIHGWACAFVTKLMSSASCSWWWPCYMLKRTNGHVLVLPSWHLVRPAADEDFVIYTYTTTYTYATIIDLFKRIRRYLWNIS